MNAKLIMLIGACPGAGKSTLSAYLAEQLELNGLNAQWFYEEAVLYEPTLTDLVEQVKQDKSVFVEAVLEAARAFTDKALNTDQIFVTDSLFPGFQWLIEKGSSSEELKSFSIKLQTIFEPLNPTLIYLDCDVRLALERAFLHRGDGYQEILLRHFAGLKINREKSDQPLQYVVDYWQMNNEMNLELLKEWSGEKVLINTTELTQLVSQALILKQLNLKAYQRAEIQQLDPQIFVGQYLTNDSTSDEPTQINIQVKAGQLRTNLYWPGGCNLVARSKTRFQLENIAQYVDFELDSDGLVTGLTYDEGHRTHYYKKESFREQ